MSKENKPQNGKGDRSRIGDIKKYRDNFGEICWKKKVCAMCNGTGYLKQDQIECICKKKDLTKRK